MAFKKGKSGNPGGRKEGTIIAPEFLRDMRHVYKTDRPDPDESSGRKMLRSLKETNPGKFLERLQAAEREWAQAKRGVAQADPVSSEAPKPAEEVDQGTMAALELVEKVLRGIPDGVVGEQDSAVA